ncbi:hypothetical protein M8J77_000352 [Diaphorina citri]|nr:hypothetical protein M8J77_000352 [Diaphorina citri]
MFLLGCTYTPPSSSVHVYLEHCQVVEELRLRFPLAHLVLLGDYNLTTAVWSTLDEVGMVVECSSSDAPAFRVCESFNGLGLTQVNSLPNNHVEWKKSFVISIFKSGDRCNISNYRGVCILSCVPKLLNKLIVEKLAFASRSFISDEQHGCDGREADGTGSVEIVGGLPYWETKSFCKKHFHKLYKSTGHPHFYHQFSNLRAQCKDVASQCYSSYLNSVVRNIKADPRYFWKYNKNLRGGSSLPKVLC